MLKGEKLKVQLNLLTSINCCGAAVYVLISGNGSLNIVLMALSGLLSLIFGFITLITLIELRDRENQLYISKVAKRMQQLALVFYTFPVALLLKVLISDLISPIV